MNPITLSESKTFCIIPWVHFHVAQNGNVIPCCQAPPQKMHRFGNINEQSIEEIWNDEPIQSFREKMIAGEKDHRCKQCYLKEKSGLKSLRQKSNTLYEEKINCTKLEIKAKEPPVYFDIRFSNACNLKCRICGPWASSQWLKDAIALGLRKPNEKALNITIKNEDSFFEEIKPFFKTAREFYFAGGEPFMMEQHYRVLDELIAAKNTNCKLNYNSNFSQLSFKDYQIIDYWKKFNCVKVSASLDAEEQRGEYLRKNIKWKDVLENRKLILKELPNLEFELNPTVCVFNVELIPEFHQNWVESGLISVEDFVPNILFNPKEYQLNVLSLKKQLYLKAKYLEHIQWIKKCEAKNELKKQQILIQFESIVDILGKDVNPMYKEVFLTKTKKLDNLRNENTFSLFPELKSEL